MDLLTAVNKILPALGEHPVTSIDARHPTLAVILPELEVALSECLLRSWWFNTSRITLYPDREGRIAVPTNVLTFLADDRICTVRGGALYDMQTRSYIWPGPVAGELTERLEFQDLPESVAYYVLYTALVSAYLTDIGLEQVVRTWQDMAAVAETTATSEHLRNKRHSTRKSTRFYRLRNAMRG